MRQFERGGSDFLPSGVDGVWWFARAALIGAALALSAISSGLLLSGAWGGTPLSSAAVQVELPETDSAVAGSGASGEPLRLRDFAPTPTRTPTPEPTATPAPKQPKAQPASEPERVESQPQQAGAAPAEPEQAAPDTSSAPPAAAPGCPTAAITGYASSLFAAINSERAANGMGALAASGCATYVAQIRSDDMASAGYFSHTSPNGSTAFSLLDAYGVPHGWAGENLARNNYPDADTVGVAIRDLMASASHRANILSGNYSAMGVAVAFDGAGMKYFTMVFIGPPV